jgi:hypothetical protein
VADGLNQDRDPDPVQQPDQVREPVREKRKGSILMELLIFLVVYLLLTQVILPKLGVPT